MDTVYVITPTVGSEHIDACIKSVRSQSYPNVKHIVVVDGPFDSVADQLRKLSDDILLVILPWNTGESGFLGGCIYSAVCQLIDTGYVIFLDDDNVLDRNHIELCIDFVKSYDLDWCYSLRKLIKRNGDYLCNDDCNSLGMWPSYDGNYHHIDTNCYFLNHEIARKAAIQLRRKAYSNGELEGDRALAKYLIGTSHKFFCTGRYSINYRVKGHSGYSDEEVQAFYLKGNSHMKNIYSKFPWDFLGCGGLMSEHPAIKFLFDES